MSGAYVSEGELSREKNCKDDLPGLVVNHSTSGKYESCM